MTAVIPAFRTFVLAFLLLAGSLAAAVAMPAQDVAASHGCTISPSVYKSSYSGRVTTYGYGKVSCTPPAVSGWQTTHTMYVQLYQNGTLIDTHKYTSSTATIAGATHQHYCSPGAYYKTVVTHYLYGQRYQSWTGSIRIC